MGEVVATSGARITNDRGVNEDAIGCLERLLDKAKNGEIVGVVAAVQYADGSVGSPRGGFCHEMTMTGALMVHVVSMAK